MKPLYTARRWQFLVDRDKGEVSRATFERLMEVRSISKIQLKSHEYLGGESLSMS